MAKKRGAVLTEPKVVEWKGERLILRPPPPGRRSIVYDYTQPSGKRVQAAVPKPLGYNLEDAWAWAEDFLAGRIEMRDAENEHDRELEAPAPTLEYLFGRYREERLPQFERRQYRQQVETAMNLFAEVWGGGLDVRYLDQSFIERFVARRRAGLHLTLESGGRKWYEPTESDTTLWHDFNYLRQVFDWALRLKSGTEWLLTGNPLDRLDLPRRRPGRVTVFTDVWFDSLWGVADEIDPSGRFRLMLVLARWTAPRQDSIGRLPRFSLCLTPEEVAGALERAQFRFVDPGEASRTWVHGAIYWPMENEKGAKNYRTDPFQYDRVLPIGPFVRQEIDHYLATHWNRRGLDADAPLFPTDQDDSKPLYRDLPQKWFTAAEGLLISLGKELPIRERTRWHGWRRQRRTELKNLRVHDKDAAAICLFSVVGLATKGAMNGHYLGFSARDLFEAACAGQEKFAKSPVAAGK